MRYKKITIHLLTSTMHLRVERLTGKITTYNPETGSWVLYKIGSHNDIGCDIVIEKMLPLLPRNWEELLLVLRPGYATTLAFHTGETTYVLPVGCEIPIPTKLSWKQIHTHMGLTSKDAN